MHSIRFALSLLLPWSLLAGLTFHFVDCNVGVRWCLISDRVLASGCSCSDCLQCSADVACFTREQEREEAEKLFAAEPDLVTAERTFEPGEGLAEAEAPADKEMEEAPPAEPSTQKGPTPQQLTAIKVRRNLCTCYVMLRAV